MPWGLKRYYGTGSLHFITWSCYRRKPLLGNPARRDPLLTVPDLLRVRYRFALIGYVVMPEHGGRRRFDRALVEGRKGVGERPHFSQRTREMGHPAALLSRRKVNLTR